MYFDRAEDKCCLRSKVMQIDQELRAWRASLPAELKLETLHEDLVDDTQPVVRIFKLQALALHMAYGNIQTLLHRPFLSQSA